MNPTQEEILDSLDSLIDVMEDTKALKKHFDNMAKNAPDLYRLFSCFINMDELKEQMKEFIMKGEQSAIVKANMLNDHLQED